MSTAEHEQHIHITVSQDSDPVPLDVHHRDEPIVDAVSRYSEQHGHPPTQTAIRLGRLADQGLLVMRPGQYQMVQAVAAPHNAAGEKVA